MEVQVAVAKVEKYAVGESGDTVEVIERPRGGISVVLVDGQRSGQSAKAVSNLVARKAIALLAEGVRDGAAARAAHDYLRTQRRGQVSAELIILSADFETGTAVISRNSRAPVLVHRDGQWSVLDQPSEAVGIYARTRPVIAEIPLRPGLVIVAVSDGVWTAGQRYGQPLALVELVQALPLTLAARGYADDILAQAWQREQGRPGDDLTVVVMRVTAPAQDTVRRLSMSLPVPERITAVWSHRLSSDEP
jgi:serine phosphatase RsbU (regulator of sigma subunit)